MIRSLYYLPGQPIQKDLPSERFPELIQNEQGVLWVDFISEPPENSLPILQDFKFHPLAIDDALQETHVPRLDDWGDYLYIVFNYMDVKKNGDGWDSHVDELDIFLGRNYIVTHHDEPITAIEETWISCDRDPRTLQEGADHLLYKIADYLITEYMPVVEKIDDAIDQIEDQIFDRPSHRRCRYLLRPGTRYCRLQHLGCHSRLCR